MKYDIDDKACGLDMPPGMHGINYPQKFVKAPLSCHPSPSPQHGKKADAAKIMHEVCHAK